MPFPKVNQKSDEMLERMSVRRCERTRNKTCVMSCIVEKIKVKYFANRIEDEVCVVVEMAIAW
jgi:hypothetical protein